MVLKLELVGIVGARSSLALNVSLLHDLILMGDTKLLICSIRCGHDYLATARITSHPRLSAALLAANTDGLLPSCIVLLAALIIFVVVRADLGLVCDRVGDRVYVVIVAELVLVRNLDVAILVERGEHPVV